MQPDQVRVDNSILHKHFITPKEGSDKIARDIVRAFTTYELEQYSELLQKKIDNDIIATCPSANLSHTQLILDACREVLKERIAHVNS